MLNTELIERLRAVAKLFNDAGLTYGVADLLTEAADALDKLEVPE